MYKDLLVTVQIDAGIKVIACTLTARSHELCRAHMQAT